MRKNSELDLLKNEDGGIHVEWQPFGKYKVVAIGAKMTDFNGVSYIENGVPMMKFPEYTVKDCRNIDGCIYYMLGKVPDTDFINLIELFQATCKELEDEAKRKRIDKAIAWKEQNGIDLNPDNNTEEV